MKYRSTRGGGSLKSFEDILVSAYAEDGGLYVPESLPILTQQQFQSWKDFDFPQVCAEIMHLFSGIDIEDLRSMTKSAFSSFNDGMDPLPLYSTGGFYILDTSLGPTMAFKDIGQQICGKLLNYVLGKQGKVANIVVETSGDTGPAAIAGVKGCKNVNIFCLYPYQRVSHIQELQMTTVDDRNVFVYRTEGTSDLQASVLKEIFADKSFVERFHVCSVNSINWVRIAAQSSYYVWAYLRLQYHEHCDLDSKGLQFVIPTGAFGNAMGGLIAKLMGVPIRNIICATNENDMVHKTITYGEIKMMDSKQTESPAMDIQFAYNLERMLYYMTNCNSEEVGRIMHEMDKQFRFEESDGIILDPNLVREIQSTFMSVSVTDEQTLSTMRSFYQDKGILLCPHSAIGVHAACNDFEANLKSNTVVCVLTAHPLKFESAVIKALGEMPVGDDKVDKLKGQIQKFQWLRIEAGSSSWRKDWIDKIKNDVEAQSTMF